MRGPHEGREVFRAVISFVPLQTDDRTSACRMPEWEASCGSSGLSYSVAEPRLVLGMSEVVCVHIQSRRLSRQLSQLLPSYNRFVGSRGVGTMLVKRSSLQQIARASVDRAQALMSALRASCVRAQHVVREFREAGAVSPQTARRFCARSRTDEDAFAYLLNIGVIREPMRGRYYLDEQSLLRFPSLWL